MAKFPNVAPKIAALAYLVNALTTSSGRTATIAVPTNAAIIVKNRFELNILKKLKNEVLKLI